MGLTNVDVAQLNHSLAGVGDAFAENRKENRAEEGQRIEEAYRKSLLDAQTERFQRQTEHETRLESGEKERYEAQKQHWKTIEDQAGLHDAFQKSVQAGKDMKDGMSTLADQVRAGAIDSKTASDYFRSAVDSTPPETKTQLMQNPAFHSLYTSDVDWTKVGAKPEPKLTPVGEVPPGGGLTPAGHYVAPPKPLTDTVTESFPSQPAVPATEAQPASSGFLGIGAKPAVPAMPAVPARGERKVTTQVPRGTGNARAITDKSGKKWLYKGSAADPTTDKDPNNWVAQ